MKLFSFKSFTYFILLLNFSLFLSSCKSNVSSPNVTSNQNSVSSSKPNFIAVDVAIAKYEYVEKAREYIGNTQPYQEVSLKSQAEGKLLELNGDIGDYVTKGTILGKLDSNLLKAEVTEAQAELKARESELAKAKKQQLNAYQELAKAKIELKQLENDVKRANLLLEEGAISQQSAEVSQTKLEIGKQTVLSAQQQIEIEKEAVTVISNRITAQKAIINQAKQKQNYSILTVPINGLIIEKNNQVGDIISANNQIIKIGDFSQVKVIVPVSDLELNKIKIGQKVSVKIDAFPQEKFTGLITKIFPIADNNTRQIPIEIVISNPNQKINGLLLARVTFQSNDFKKIIIPESAINFNEDKTTVFVVKNNSNNNQTIVEEREVLTGEKMLGNVEINQGLMVGEKYVIKSAKPLQNNQQVKLSILSE